MDRPSPEKMFKDGVYMILSFSGKNPKEDEKADFVTDENEKKTAYFLSRETDESVVDKATQNIDMYDEIYLVFGNEKKYREIRDKISKRIGIILYGDLYGFGYLFSTQRICQRGNG